MIKTHVCKHHLLMFNYCIVSFIRIMSNTLPVQNHESKLTCTKTVLQHKTYFAWVWASNAKLRPPVLSICVTVQYPVFRTSNTQYTVHNTQYSTHGQYSAISNTSKLGVNVGGIKAATTRNSTEESVPLETQHQSSAAGTMPWITTDTLRGGRMISLFYIR